MKTYAGNVDGLRRERFNNGAWSMSTGPVRRGHSEKVSQRTVGWKTMNSFQRKKAAWLPYSAGFEQWDYNYGYAVGYNWAPLEREGYLGNDFQWSVPSFCSVPGNWNIPTGDARKKALSKVQNKIAQSSVNLAQAYAERKQTADLLAKSFGRLVNMVLLAKKGKFNDLYLKYGVPPPRKTRSGAWAVPRYQKVTRRYSVAFDEKGNPLANPKTVIRDHWVDVNRPGLKLDWPNMWLELQYGWKPLLQDIYGTAEQLAWQHAGGYRPLRFQGVAEDEFQKNEVYSGNWSISGTNFSIISHQRVKERVRFIIEAVEDSQALALLASIGATNPANLAWELLPYSFVIDWFIPIGNWLQQLEYARGMSFHRGLEITKREGASSVEHRFASVTPGYTKGRCDGGEVEIEKIQKSRVVLTEFPYQKFPSFQPKLGVERILSGYALLQQLMTTGKTSVRR